MASTGFSREEILEMHVTKEEVNDLILKAVPTT